MNSERDYVNTFNPISAMREGMNFTRATVGVMLTSFLTLTLSPSVVIAGPGTGGANGPKFEASLTSDDRLNDAIRGATEKLRSLEASLARGDANPSLKELAVLKSEIIAADGEVSAAFSSDLVDLKQKRLPQLFQERHASAFQAYKKNVGKAVGILESVLKATDVPLLKRSVGSALAWYERQQIERAHQSFDPARPSLKIATAKVRAAKNTKRELDEVFSAALRSADASEQLPLSARTLTAASNDVLGLNDETTFQQYRAKISPIEIASLAPLSAQMVAAALAFPGPEFLAPTEDVQITQAIRDLAAELHNQPVEICNWVRNNIEFIPTYGSLQGSELTLQSKRGNAFDTASLLIALLRASNIPARYVYGTVQIPAQKVMNWTGGFDSAAAAGNMMGQGGIPHVGLVSGGSIAAFKIEHVWVEAFVDYYPSRGAKNLAPDSWVPFDPSFKQYDEQVSTIVPTNTELDGAVSDYLNSASYDSMGGVYGLNAAVMDGMRSAYRQRVNDVMADKVAEVPLEAVLGGRTIRQSAPPVLAASLPYKLVAATAPLAKVPDTLRASVIVELRDSRSLDPESPALLSWQSSLPKLGFSSVHLVPRPASQDDAEAWNSYETGGNSSFPPYLIHISPTLEVNGIAVAAAPAQSLGGQQYLFVQINEPAKSSPAQFLVTAGDQFEISVIASGVTAAQGMALEALATKNETSANLYVASKALWVGQDYWDRLVAQMHRTVIVRRSAAGIFSSPIDILYRFGVPQAGSYKSRLVDIKHSEISLVSRDGSADKSFLAALHSGAVLSSHEGAALEAVFGQPLGRGSNSARLLELANEQQIPIYQVNSSNFATIAPVLQHATAVMADVQAAVNNGYEVLIPKTKQTNKGWTGSGYIIIDPLTGAGDYRISGGASGNVVVECVAEPQPVKVNVMDISIIALLILNGLIDDNGDWIGDGVAEAALSAAAVGAIVRAASAIRLTSTLLAGRSGFAAALGTIGIVETASAGEDECSCSPAPINRRGGFSPFTQIHNACADREEYTDEPQKDIFLNGKAFDGIKRGEHAVYEIKTGLSYSRLELVKNIHPDLRLRSYFAFIQRAEIARSVIRFLKDRVRAVEGCGYEYRYGVRSIPFARDMRIGLANAADAGRVFVNDCDPQ